MSLLRRFVLAVSVVTALGMASYVFGYRLDNPDLTAMRAFINMLPQEAIACVAAVVARAMWDIEIEDDA